jgi:hypothetical protein
LYYVNIIVPFNSDKLYLTNFVTETMG